MIIEVRHDRLSAMASRLESGAVSQLGGIRQKSLGVAHQALPQAGASEDLRAAQQNLDAFSQQDLGSMIEAVDGFAKTLRSMERNYEQAQTGAITRALLL